MDKRKLDLILEHHKLWLNYDSRGQKALLINEDLIEQNLIRAYLYKADLQGAVMHHANLSYANLEKADLRGADLRQVKFTETYLAGANLVSARYSPRSILELHINPVISEDLRVELMRWNSLVCGEQKMNVWSKSVGLYDSSPFEENYDRLFNFQENKELWRPGPPKTNIMELWQWVAKELEITIS